MSTDQIEIHLFPLPNVVLFPSVMLPLHIFEERYKAMVNGCINDEAPFGIVLLKGEQENESTIQKVGVLARVVEVERLEDGRMNIWTKGEERFRITRLTQQEPWWRGVVELLDDRPDPESEVAALADEVGELYREAYRKGIRLTGERPGKLELPTSAGDLSFMVSYVLDMDFQEKQNLLEMTSVKERLGALVAYLKHANARLEQQIHQQQIVETVRGNGDLGNPGKEH
jgi:Lon protease-like protein